MIENYPIQMYLRGLLLDRVELIQEDLGEFRDVSINIIGENLVREKNYKDITIEEEYEDTSQSGYTLFSDGTGYYALMVSDDRDTGLRLRRFVDLLAPAFPYGEHKVCDDISICVNTIETNRLESEQNDTKVHALFTIFFTKFK